ncbi:MAG TPA: DUF4124 domain-containing protein [Candidatus Competibacteraceae bacterium]|nr:DUF4124 domain-containing protein [Candidatus Competibacteraceae bacterium]
MRSLLLPLMVFLLALGAVQAQTGIYSWRDANGNIIYGDAPPEGSAARPVTLPESAGQGSVPIYVWLDAQGQTHYGSQPPAGLPARRLETVPPETQPGAAAEGETVIYTWRDASGQAHYGTTPPEGVDAEPVALREPAVTTINASELRPGEREALREFEQRRAGAQAAPR